MGSIICSLLRSKMKEQQSNYRVLADPKHILQILFCSEQRESVGTKEKQALAQAIFHAGVATAFWKHQSTLHWIQTQPRLWHELQSKCLESGRLLSSVHRRTTHADINCCTPLQASHVPKDQLSQGAVIHHGNLAQPFGLVGAVNTIAL